MYFTYNELLTPIAFEEIKILEAVLELNRTANLANLAQF